MSREEAIETLNNIKNPYHDRRLLAEVLDFLNIKHNSLACSRCCIDYYNIAREELGLIEDASEFSSFNGDKEYIYLLNRTFKWNWNGKIFTINQNTPKYIIEEFIKTHKGYYSIRDTKKS